MTTIPSRLPLLDATLDCLLSQSFSDFDLDLHIPKVCQRTGERYVLPESLENYGERLTIRRIDTDYGPATKLLGAVAGIGSSTCREQDLVITVDDDVVLERHALEELIAASARYPREAIGFMGVVRGQFVHAESVAAQGLLDQSVSVLGGYRAVLYPVAALDESMFSDYLAAARRCTPFLDDDHLFSWNLARRGIGRRVIATEHPGPCFGLNVELLDRPDPIHFGADAGLAAEASHRCLTEYYESNGWHFPT